MKEEIILVDFSDRQIGFCEKLEAHHRNRLHRAFSVFLYDPDGREPRMLLQKRAVGKYHSGGLWTNACCSHPRKGETLSVAVPRRMREELGIVTPVREIFSFCYFHQFSDHISEFEFDHVFCGQWRGSILPNPAEIAEIAWIPFQS